MLSHDEVVRLYGPWRRRTPRDTAILLGEYPSPWWIAGGWAIDAFVGSAREHGDIDIGIPRGDAGTFIEFVAPDLDVWAASGSLTPIPPGKDAAVPDDCGNLWLRPSGADPWEYDVLLESVGDETWSYKHDPDITRPLSECLWSRDGISYLRPEVQLLLKARHPRPKDTVDLERCLPHLGPGECDWLARIIRRAHPNHPWLGPLRSPRTGPR